MAGDQATAALAGGVALLERAIAYTLGSLNLVTPDAFGHPTPCRAWDLRALLAHLTDSMTTMAETVTDGRIELAGPGPGGRADPGAGDPTRLRDLAGGLLGAWAAAARPTVTVGGFELNSGVVASTGALELAIHGWDVGWACGQPRPIPAALAEELLELAPLLIGVEDRVSRFAVPVAVSTVAGPADRLLAYLGRAPA
jgi:uncharacterized protein (TIGR03086 family)